MKSYLIFVLSVILMSCAETSQDSSSPTKSNLTLNELITGTWKYTNQATTCETIFVFDSDLQFTYSSLVNITSGNYTISDSSVANDYDELDLFFTADNLLATCGGSSTDRTGLGIRFYVKFNDGDTLSFYSNATETVPIQTLTKQP